MPCQEAALHGLDLVYVIWLNTREEDNDVISWLCSGVLLDMFRVTAWHLSWHLQHGER